jgi:hypothetical protein
MGFIQTSSSGQIVHFRKKEKWAECIEFFFTTFNIWASACGCVYTAVLYTHTHTHNDERRAYLEIWKVSTAVTSKWCAAPSFSLAASFRRVPPLFVFFQVIFFSIFYFFQREKKYTHIFKRKKKKKNGIHETVCNDTKTTTESQKKKEKKKC